MFKEEVIKTEKGFIIRVRAEKLRKYVFEEKEVYREDVKKLIPEEFRNSVTLVSGPSKLVSNYGSGKFVNSAEWIFELEEKEEPPTARKTRTRRKTTKKQETTT